MPITEHLDIEVTITESKGRKETGPVFHYRCTQPHLAKAVHPNGDIDLGKLANRETELRFRLTNQDAKFDPTSPIWLLKLGKGRPAGKSSCPDRKRRYLSFPVMSRENARSLRLVDTNVDHHAYAYALRCEFRGERVFGDPVIINR